MNLSSKTLTLLLLAAFSFQGYAQSRADKATHQKEQIADAHLHLANYAMQGVPLKTFIRDYMGHNIARSTIFGLPLQQKWDDFEHYADDKMPPNYYLGPKAQLYYYSFIDAMIAKEYLGLSKQDKARVDPMIVGFNPMDRYGVQHIKRMLLMYPGVFSGIGEFSVHKELVGDKIADNTIKSVSKNAVLPSDVHDSARNSLYNPALAAILNFSAESGLLVNLHSDIYRAEVTPDGQVLDAKPQSEVYVEGMKHLCKASPNAKVYWAHTGLGRFVNPQANHLKLIEQVLDACPNWSVDVSWDLVQNYIVTPEPGMPALSEWAAFITKYQDRVLWGSDTVMYTRNKMDTLGNVTIGKEMTPKVYLEVKDILRPLWKEVGEKVANKVRFGNYVRLFDDARKQVRHWEHTHSNDDVWDLPATPSVKN